MNQNQINKQIMEARAKAIEKSDKKLVESVTRGIGKQRKVGLALPLTCLIVSMMAVFGLIIVIVMSLQPDIIHHTQIVKEKPVVYKEVVKTVNNITNYAQPEGYADCVKIENEFGRYSLHCKMIER